MDPTDVMRTGEYDGQLYTDKFTYIREVDNFLKDTNYQNQAG